MKHSLPVSIHRAEAALTERTMFLFSVLMFFLLTCFCAWLLLFPTGRDVVTQSLVSIGRRLERHLRGGYRQGAQQAQGLGRGVRGSVQLSLEFLRRRGGRGGWLALGRPLDHDGLRSRRAACGGHSPEVGAIFIVSAQ
jgi:hypothetical protein